MKKGKCVKKGNRGGQKEGERERENEREGKSRRDRERKEERLKETECAAGVESQCCSSFCYCHNFLAR